MENWSNKSTVPPLITCVRHAQGVHNLSFANHSIRDPDLTPFGEQQCSELAHNFPDLDSVDLLVCSPLRRTIYTALLSFPALIEKGVKLIALPELQETADVPCDTGTDIFAQRKEMQGKPVDLSLVMKGWEEKKGRWAPTEDAIKERAKEARQWLRSRPEKHIIVVTHGGFLHFFTQNWSDYKKKAGTGWQNCEHRSYEFVDKGRTASIRETAVSQERRKGKETGLTATEKNELDFITKKTFDDEKL